MTPYNITTLLITSYIILKIKAFAFKLIRLLYCICAKSLTTWLGIPPFRAVFLFIIGGIADELLLKTFVFLSVNET